MENAAAELQSDLQEQHRKLTKKQRFSSSRQREGNSGSWKTENPRMKRGDNAKGTDLCVGAFQPQLVQKTVIMHRLFIIHFHTLIGNLYKYSLGKEWYRHNEFIFSYSK